MSIDSVAVLAGRERENVAGFFAALTAPQRQTVSELVSVAYARGKNEATRRERLRARQRESKAEPVTSKAS